MSSIHPPMDGLSPALVGMHIPSVARQYLKSMPTHALKLLSGLTSLLDH